MTDRTHGPFKVGDLVVGVGLVIWPEFNGMQGTVLQFLPKHDAVCHKTGKVYVGRDDYLVEWSNGVKQFVEALNLRRIDPPSDQYIRQETTDWSKCAWQPQRTEA